MADGQKLLFYCQIIALCENSQLLYANHTTKICGGAHNKRTQREDQDLRPAQTKTCDQAAFRRMRGLPFLL